MKELIDEKVFVAGLYIASAALVAGGLLVVFFARRAKNTGARFAGIALLLAGPLLCLLWQVYTRIIERFGLDSVKGLGVNILFFVVAGVLIGLLLGRIGRRHSDKSKEEAAG